MNENLKKKLIEYTAENAFVQACGIEIWELEEDHAVMGTTARPELLNPMGMLHGGLLFTLADCCSGVTARTDGRTYVTQTGSLNYYRNIHEGQVYAVGKVQHRGRTVRERNAETAGSGNILHVCNAELNEQMLDRGKLESILREWLKIRGALC